MSRKDIKQINKYCEYCGKKLERKRYNWRLEDFGVFNRRKYCNKDCMRKAFIKVGINDNQSYSNAHCTARHINGEILQIDKCQICGKDGKLDVHHIDGNYQNNTIGNLMILCRSCHMKIHKPQNKCKICDNYADGGLGYCNKHYLRYKKYGNPLLIKLCNGKYVERI